MAEIAVPLAALGVMYIMSNKNEPKPYKEEFTSQRLPNLKQRIKNYPAEKSEDILNKTNVQTYQGYKNTADEYYKPENYNLPEHKNQTYNSMSGEQMSVSDLQHNNMVPFFGSKITQNSVNKGYENLLNNYTGVGNQENKKEGIAPLFKPEANMTHTYGAPNSTDFYQDRMKNVLTSKMNNVKPWQEIQVGPGLNKGYTTEGSGGFNSGMEARDKYMPKRVDELRTVTNPKVQYAGQVLGAYVGNGSTNLGIHGKISKNRPDTYYENSSDRWFTTTGIEKAQKARSDVILQPENRTTTTREYFGGGDRADAPEGPHQPGHYRQSHKQQLKGPQMGSAIDKDGWNGGGKNIEKNSYKARTNARSFTTERSQMGIVSGVVNALTTPILDILRPSRKQNVIGNMRPMGNVQGANSVNAPNVFNPNDTPHHTIREQTENTPYWLMGGNDKADGYTIANIRAVQQQRESTNRYRPNAPGALSGTTKPMPYDAQYNMRTNPNKEVVSQVNRYNIGNQSLGSRAQNVTNLRNRAVNPSELRMNMPKVSGNMSTHGELSGKNTRETAINCARNNPQLLSAFHQNPYTKSLNSWA